MYLLYHAPFEMLSPVPPILCVLSSHMCDSEIQQLRKTVQEAIDQGRLGQPQFLRCIVEAGNGEPPDRTLKTILSLSRSWFGSCPVQHYRLGADGVYLTEMAKWAGGQAALITVHYKHIQLRKSDVPGADEKQIDLMLIGSRGTLYHDRENR